MLLNCLPWLDFSSWHLMCFFLSDISNISIKLTTVVFFISFRTYLICECVNEHHECSHHDNIKEAASVRLINKHVWRWGWLQPEAPSCYAASSAEILSFNDLLYRALYSIMCMSLCDGNWSDHRVSRSLSVPKRLEIYVKANLQNSDIKYKSFTFSLMSRICRILCRLKGKLTIGM